MKHFSKLLFVFLVSLIFEQAGASDIHIELPVIYSETPDSTANQQNDSTRTTMGKLDHFNDVMEKIVVYSPLPVVSYSTETDWLFGLTKINAFRIGTKDQHDTTFQPSHITALAYLTLANQYKVAVTADLMFGHNKYKSYTELLFIDFPNFYFGVGDDTKLNDECLVETENFSITQIFGYKLTKRWYIGLKYHYNNYYKVDTVPNGEHCNNDVPDLTVNEGTQSGIGITINRETRDNRFNARRGSYLFFEYLNYGKWIGSKFNYHSIILEYRKYYTPLKWLTLAGQIYTETKIGDNIPVQSLSLMGGDNRMRGIYIGRFRDKNMIEGQIEARFPIFWIFGGVVFTGLGEVAPTIKAYTWQGIKWTYGAGLRMNVNKATRTNIRFDIGFFEHHPLFFFTFSEAF
jgi:outer membrane protein assembly factor BamA